MIAIQRFIGILSILIVAACGQPTSWDSKLITVKRVVGSDHCHCPSGGLYLENNSSKKAKINVENIRRWKGNEHSRSTKSHILTAGDRKFLGCSKMSSPDATPGFPNCQMDNRFFVRGSSEVSMRNFFQPVQFAYSDNSLSALIMAQAATDQRPSFSCKNECLDPKLYNKNGLCHKMSSLPKEHLHGIRKLSTAINDSDAPQIKKADIMDWFQIANDPCGRSDTNLSENRLTNSGDVCIFESRFANFGEPLIAKLVLPSQITASKTTSDKDFDLSFDTAAQRPMLEISDNLLNSDFGGTIFQIETSQSNLILTTKNGCLSAEL